MDSHFSACTQVTAGDQLKYCKVVSIQVLKELLVF